MNFPTHPDAGEAPSSTLRASADGIARDIGVFPLPDADAVRPAPGWLVRAARRAVAVGLTLPRALTLADVAALLVAGPRTSTWFAAVMLYLGLAWHGGLYRSRLTLLLLDDLFSLTGRLLAASALAAAVDQVRDVPLTSGWWGDVALAIAALIAARLAVYAGARAARRHRLVNHSVLIVGSGRVGRYLAAALTAHPEYGLRPSGFYDPDPPPSDHPPVADLPFHASDGSLEDAVRESGSAVVLLAFASMPAEQLVVSVRACAQLDAEIFYVPRLFDLSSVKANDIDDVWGLPLVRLRRASFRSGAWRTKRITDVALAGTALFLLAPLLAVIAVLVRLFLGDPVLFRQRRIGLDRRPFTILKFRSLPNADVDLTDLDWNAADRRPNLLGKVLRATSLDELPQLWNILRGDMSFVGPRPERTHFVEQFADELDFYDDRHRVPPGLTGLAQIHGLRGDTSIHDRARFDNAYVERWSPTNDLKILLRTPLAMVRWRGR